MYVILSVLKKNNLRAIIIIYQIIIVNT